MLNWTAAFGKSWAANGIRKQGRDYAAKHLIASTVMRARLPVFMGQAEPRNCLNVPQTEGHRAGAYRRSFELRDGTAHLGFVIARTSIAVQIPRPPLA